MAKQTKLVAHPYLVVALALLLALSASIAHAQRPAQRVAIATRSLARGTVLSADDFVYRDTTMRAPVEPSRVDTGWVTRSAIAAGDVLREPAVQPPIVISANQTVDLEWQDVNVRLIIRGTATRNASLGDRVIVRTDAGRRIEGTVIAPGRVRID
jgi:flagellar basal body P-ring formation protein FlgA